ncbi:hypothetical protein Dsin_012417 [Dipteronia sinensis]|uniref:Major facilitator superfamily (MFS) profile domain-containing protein n=1 Tax=Dipteronia sinensis TaxID=43782 RepID=A0AAE0AI11_9ROSI|nr:hypothetical protein Dsin_012417 [Dipteronia sinensis]
MALVMGVACKNVTLQSQVLFCSAASLPHVVGCCWMLLLSFGSIMTIGGLLGSLINGKVADLIGRKGGAWLLDLGRVSLGIGIGMNAYAAKIGRDKELEASLQSLRGGNADIYLETVNIKVKFHLTSIN